MLSTGIAADFINGFAHRFIDIIIDLGALIIWNKEDGINTMANIIGGGNWLSARQAMSCLAPASSLRSRALHFLFI